MASRDHLKILKQGAESWNAWRKANRSVKPRLSNAKLQSADLKGFDLSGVDLSGAHLRFAKLHRAVLGATYFPLNLGGANLRGADLSHASLFWANLNDADLTGANLQGASIINATLYGAKLRKANLSGASLNGSAMSGADLRAACLTSALLHGSVLINASLRKADLSRASLSGAILRGTDLSGATLSGSIFRETIFGDTNLTDAIGLDSAVHEAASTLDHRTLLRSGELPLSFLRGCGLPDTLIEYLPSLLNRAMEYHSCFISYSSVDQPFANRLYADLQHAGVRCWFAPHNVQGGEKLEPQIDEAIRMNDRLLLILSPASMSSPWVETEIAKARQREIRENRRILFPIRLVDFSVLRAWSRFDADTGKDLAREIREYFIPDFSRWRERAVYQEGFGRLLKDLKANVSQRRT